MIEFFSLGVPAYRLRFQVPYSKPTILKWFRILREAIYQDVIKDLKPLSKEIEMDETMTGGKRPGKRGWGATGKTIVFGIYPDAVKSLLFLSLHMLKRLCSLTLPDIPKLEVYTTAMTVCLYLPACKRKSCGCIKGKRRPQRTGSHQWY